MANKQTYAFNKSLKDMSATDLSAKIQDDQLRLKKLGPVKNLEIKQVKKVKKCG